ncbi:hypothetical protein SAICODRAFT_29485 [Saitoella complicata NRRL Y-17804]|uniref:uncharacterized protein n=1 Tax=Saitoella complicata (strain BCRC 22490 / CBS 7301 / JCM 7358 / NBRC 10748 / NRRL Y-17804) TaxID=698492 RepID=UPI000866E11D|nr:uncharacterized protein SAICODRAFT_29485 [Saitoella complicata NRRL Y-17804]ODQ54321.1 hypothetical protein SAICODRAFT_29485 [Saitoella complicata NRRL Y-17804]
MKSLLTILSAHPRLGAKKVESTHSQSEQSSLGGGPDETQALVQLNREYEDTFPGLRYVTFVNGRSRGEIMEDMRERIEGGRRGGGAVAVAVRDTVWRGEVEDAIEAMCEIAGDRVKKLLATS